MDAKQEIDDQLAALADHSPAPCTSSYDRGAIHVARWLIHGAVSPELKSLLDELRQTKGGDTMQISAEELAKQAKAAKDLAAEQHAAIIERAGKRVICD